MKYYNLPLEEVVRRFPHYGKDEHVLMQGSVALARRPGAEPEDLILAYYVVQREEGPPRHEQTYREVRLIRESVSLAELRTRLARAGELKSVTLVEGVSIELEGIASMELLPSDEPTANLGPRYLVELSAKRRGELSGAGPLIRYGQSSFVSVEQAVRSWIPLRPFHGSSDSRLGRCLLEIPLGGPRFGAIELLNERTLRVGFERISPDTPAELTGVWQSADASTILPFTYQAGKEPIDLTKPAWADRVALWLVTADSETRDYFSEDAYSCSRRRRILYAGESNKREDEVSILARIQGGEDERVEFKPFLRLESVKADELVRTVIAFANKRGGTIYLGVNDHQEIDGVEKDLREFAPSEKKGSISECAAWYCAAIRKRIADRVSSTVIVECDPIQVCGKLLIRVSVMESKSKPCCDVSTKEIWTRRGANTVRPDPSGDELKQLVSGSNQATRPL